MTAQTRRTELPDTRMLSCFTLPRSVDSPIARGDMAPQTLVAYQVVRPRFIGSFFGCCNRCSFSSEVPVLLKVE